MIRLESSALIVDVLPEVGGKIGQIRDKALGCDLLVPPQKPLRTIPTEESWLEYDTSGMDDCFPNIAAGPYPEPPWPSHRFPDLGEWSHSVWKVDKSDEREIAMSRSGHVLPYAAVKTVGLADERTLEFSYHVLNWGRFPIRYLWSAHPLFAVDDAFELQFPPGDLKFRLFPHDGEVHKWPTFKGRQISSEWIPRGTTLKIFVSGFDEGTCLLVLPWQTIRFTFDSRSLPAVGVWFNHFGFPRQGGRPFRCIAVEPCTTPSDLLDDLDSDFYPRIPPGESAVWEMRLSVLTRASYAGSVPKES